MSDAPAAFKDIYFTVRDGLRLYARHYPAARPGKTRPVLCLAGLTRNSRDFHRIAGALAADAAAPRDVYTLDTRGRGLSEHDGNWKNYTVPNEMQDVLDFMTMMELTDCGIIGTSRGGLITMVMAAAQPTRIGAAVLNDIGPVIETQGLMRIAGYVGRTPLPKSWSDAARTVGELMSRDFPTLKGEEAEAFARQLFNDRNGRPAPGYDAKIARGFSMLDGPMPQLWPQFAALKNAPVLVVRGANSDLLSQATVDEMTRRHPNCSSHTVPGEGHAPLLWDAPTIAAIASFFAGTDASHRARASAAA
ncbi:MAG TPA: alpha/beta hydrolase [Hyphomicrobium sp.]|nr:alpha/beta hydrolase [Hyphomicrobium sp.]